MTDLLPGTKVLYIPHTVYANDKGPNNIPWGTVSRVWDAVVADEVTKTPREVTAVVEGKEQTVLVFDETHRLMLDVKHPNGFMTLHLPMHDIGHDERGKAPHTYHLPEEAGR